MSEFLNSVEEPIQRLSFAFAGGMNAWDFHDQLIRRSHQQGQGGWDQVAPMESSRMQNVDFFTEGWGQRLGSTEAEDLTGVLLSGDVLRDGVEWADPASGTRSYLVISDDTIYTNQSGSWAQIKHNNSGGTAYTHAATPTKWSWVKIDGHLLILLDDTDNTIQVYRSGDALDDPLYNHTTTTTVDADSASGQTVLNVASTTPFKVGCRVNIDPDSSGGGQEYGHVASISAGVSITLMDNLANTHTAAQGDTVQVDDAYVEAYDTSTSHSVTGLWETGTYLGEGVNDRLAYGTGNPLLEYTPRSRTSSSGIWDLAGTEAGFYGARANIVAIASFVPEGGDVNQQLLHIFTSAGPGIVTGFQDYDQAMDANRQAGGVPLNHRCVVAIKGWLVYLTENRDIEAINGPVWINLGRRLRTAEGTGPLDSISVTNSATSAFGFYDRAAERVIFQASTASGRVNDLAAVVDVRLGEPARGESPSDYERKVRVHYWSLINPDSNAWFGGMFQVQGSVLGVHQDGKLYTVGGSGLPRTDMDTLAIESRWDMPWFNGGSILLRQFFQNAILRFKRVGAWEIDVDVYVDYADDVAKTVTVLQTIAGSAVYDTALYDEDTYVEAGVILKLRELDRYQQAMKLSIANETISRYWVCLAGLIEYQAGSMEV